MSWANLEVNQNFILANVHQMNVAKGGEKKKKQTNLKPDSIVYTAY